MNSSFTDFLQPDANVDFSQYYDELNGLHGYQVQYGRIHIDIDNIGSVRHEHDSQLIRVTDTEVMIDISLTTATNVLTMYAVRRLKIWPRDEDIAVTLTPMQPNAYGNSPVVDGYFTGKPKPVDFTCTELDISAISGLRAVLTMVSSGGFDNSSSAMTYNFGSSDEGNENSACTVGVDIDPQSQFSHAHLPKCSSYYTKALHRQHSKSSLFRDFSPELGRAYLVSSPGYYAACVSVANGAAGSIVQDGVIVLRYTRKDVKDKRACPPATSLYHAGSGTSQYYPSSTSAPYMPNQYSTAPSALLGTTTHHNPPSFPTSFPNFGATTTPPNFGATTMPPSAPLGTTTTPPSAPPETTWAR